MFGFVFDTFDTTNSETAMLSRADQPGILAHKSSNKMPTHRRLGDPPGRCAPALQMSYTRVPVTTSSVP